MKYYQFGDLDAFIQGRGRASDLVSYSKLIAVSIFRQLCSGVEAMHSAEFAHCDLKPANILLDFDQSSDQLLAVISDLGIARIVSDKSLKVAAFEASSLRGLTLSYAAPEVISRYRNQTQVENSAPILKAGDVYALAIIALEILLRRSVWQY